MSGNCGKTEYLNILNEALEELEPFVIGQGPLAEIIESFAVFIRRFFCLSAAWGSLASEDYRVREAAVWRNGRILPEEAVRHFLIWISVNGRILPGRTRPQTMRSLTGS